MLVELKGKVKRIMGIGETTCGTGSYKGYTHATVDFFENVFKYYSIQSIIDVGCGDWNWMQAVSIAERAYTGYDKDQGFIDRCNSLWGKNPNRRFLQHNVLDAVNRWAKVDLIICRDLFIHLTNDTIIKMLKEFKESKSTWLITTTYPNCKDNVLLSGNEASYTNTIRPSRVINMMLSPYHLPMPYVCVKEHPMPVHKGRMIGLWKLDEIVELI